MAPVKGGFNISAHISMLRTFYTVSKSVIMGQMSFYSMCMKYLERPKRLTTIETVVVREQRREDNKCLSKCYLFQHLWNGWFEEVGVQHSGDLWWCYLHSNWDVFSCTDDPFFNG